ncbi:hypothetical protein JRO89_XS08G0232600 [Xanthoceras sorbifolium]|uniref:Uncharacterized protein n=1 Tax=Xanthoceras sorbifolium TaxID=99658 RepID=A0ABQ8HR02_9ROSI|nr:hypothetical protein JRO89_XS08G0232600 [Xanthoceras sorbifolium]
MSKSSKISNNIGEDEQPHPPNNPTPESNDEPTPSTPAPPPPSTAVDEAQMARTQSKDSAPSPSWFTPKRLLIIFCVINMLNYLDRGVIASNGVNGSLTTCDDKGICTAGSGIQGDFKLNNFQDGVLSSAFMVGLLVASPIFASLSKSYNPFRLIGVGLSVWTFATAGCGSSFDFWSIAICRMLVGVGEASFISLAAPFIDDHAPVAQFTSMIPENSLARNVLHVYTNWNCRGLCLRWIFNLNLGMLQWKPPNSLSSRRTSDPRQPFVAAPPPAWPLLSLCVSSSATPRHQAPPPALFRRISEHIRLQLPSIS